MSLRNGEPRFVLSESETTRVEINDAGLMYVQTGNTTLCFTKAECEELTTSLAKAVVRLAKLKRQEAEAVNASKTAVRRLSVVHVGDEQSRNNHMPTTRKEQ